MTTINLRQNQQKVKSGFPGEMGNSGFVFSLGILAFTLLVLFGLKLYVPVMENRNNELDKAISVENNKLVGLKSLEQVIDMQSRLKEIKSNLQMTDGQVTRLEMTGLLGRLGGEMNSNVSVSEFNYSPDKISIAIESNNFSDIAKQILTFKKSDYFSGVNVVSINRGEKTVVCNVAMNVKK
jgi:hypothetical protein